MSHFHMPKHQRNPGPSRTNEISDRFREKSKNIMEDWESRARHEIYKSFGRDSLVLRNSLPVFLTLIADALSNSIDRTPRRVATDRREIVQVGKTHGRERAEFDEYSLTQLIYEYHILRQCIFSHMEEQDTLPKRERDVITDAIEQTVNDACSQFAQTLSDVRAQREEERLQRVGQKLRGSELRFDRLVASLTDYAVFILDAQGLITSWNEGARRLKGYEENEILGKHFSIFYPKEDQESGKPDRELIEAEIQGRYAEEGWRIRKDGSQFWASVLISLIRDEFGNAVGFSKVTRDLSERKRHDDSLKQAYETLERRVQERTLELKHALDSRDEFISIASHELKTPLAALGLQLQILTRTLSTPRSTLASVDSRHDEKFSDKVLQSIKSCEKQSTRMAALLDELFDLARIRSGQLQLNREHFDICKVVCEMVTRKEAEVREHGIDLSVTTCGSTTGSWDLLRVEQIIGNLLSNAVKYGEGKPIQVTLESSPKMVTLSVKDHGRGIPPELQETIFSRFERAVSDRSISGLGLGLYIVRQIAEAHGGLIKVKSEIGKGAEFIVSLPFGN